MQPMDNRDTAAVRSDPSEPGTGRRGLVMVVDADEDSRGQLVGLLRSEGFDTLEADSGEGALDLFETSRSDMVFVDAHMPDMDGYETSRYLKTMAGDAFLPVVLTFCAEDDETLLACVRSGGDDFLLRPYDSLLLRMRILAMERMRDLQCAILASSAPLAQLLDREYQEQVLAERVFSRAIRNRNVMSDLIAVLQRSSALFCGDLVLTQHLPDGGLRVLIGDFTGQGLAATIGALPVAEAFHAMTAKGVDDEEVLSEINGKLYELLPQDRFMSATLISVPGSGRYLHWWNGGMPSAWLRTAEGLYELSSHAVSLGVLPRLPKGDVPRRISVRPGDGLLIFSDGLLEARDVEGRSFDERCFRSVLSGWQHRRQVFPALAEALERHCEGVDQPDDIAMLEIPLESHLFSIPEPIHCQLPEGGWTWSIELRGEHLGPLHAVDSLLRPLGLVDGLETHLPVLETIVGELYANALEHGLSIVPVAVKVAPNALAAGEEAFRELPANPLGDGWIRIRIRYLPCADGGGFSVCVEHSGKGFDCCPDEAGLCLPPQPWGEGLVLLHGLCESLSYSQEGRRADAFYRWWS
ncbi:SpoIIE family protein phosphatase [Imhoffiella purpurea]|uniref:Response regulatory domain-containing protein n=1 Tax=Imhoffiella purpurea TaxID=1249627 RepID=W9VGJ3_9GAMM|nr:SpoIIE family protein phosphatase [Imhoffiella purpurea]EXJ16126.1 hypothetical protein D779_0595 [Imhoffiella purpurea]